MSVFLHPIYSQTVGVGGVSSLVFNNIPQGFTDLKVVISARVSGAGASYVGAFPNNDTSSIYSYTYVGINPTAGTVYTGHTINSPYGLFVYCANASMTANSFTNMEIYIPNYSRGGLKQAIVDDCSETNAVDGASISATTVLMNSNNPITSLVVKDTVTGGTLVQGSTVTIYGISSAFQGGAPAAPVISTVTDQASFASVAFNPAANDGAQLYAVTTSPATSTTYGSTSPITAPAPVGTATTFRISAVNDKGISTSTASEALTTANSYSSIATVTSSGSTSGIQFNNIPQNYSHLQLRIFARSARAAVSDYTYMRMNGDSSASYSWHRLYGDSSAVYSDGVINDNTINSIFIPGASSPANYFGVAVVDFLEYSSASKFKTVKALNAFDANNAGANNGITNLLAGTWQNNSPITSLILANYFVGSNYAAGTTFALYGIA